MPLMSWMISMACANAYQNNQDACNKALEASAKQVKLYQTDEQTEHYLTIKAENTAKNSLGTASLDVFGVMGYSYKVYKNRAIDFKLPTMGVAETASTHVTTNSYALNLGWSFPWLK